ncbi:MAG: YhcH/YjgK/YiaL family protein [Nitrospiraceae bacterium]|nr:YhcH/YjgK/YiaL family protein [Nitrospiraceae bacterium]
MIVDTIDNWNLYFTKGSALYEGIDFIKNFSEAAGDGRYEIRGQEIYAVVQSYETQQAAGRKIESHKKFIDIQYILSGEEVMGWLPAAGLAELSAYSEENDILFYHQTNVITPIIMAPGIFAVFFPHDAHQPGCIYGQIAPVRKIVVKVACHLAGENTGEMGHIF